MYIIICPNCGNREVKAVGLRLFECCYSDCMEEFEIGEVDYEEIEIVDNINCE